MYNILICEDEQDIINALRIYLANPDYNIFEAHDGCEAIEAVKRNDIHLVLMDIMMPKKDGITATSQIRSFSNVPVIFLTAKSEDTDKILGLNIGADDYITKPFNPVEVSARVRSQLRRYLQLGGGKISSDSFTIGGIELNDRTKTVLSDGEEVSLTPKEFEILRLLMSNAGKVFSPKEIYRAIWNEDPLSVNNPVAVHIRHLREKLEINPAEPRYIKLVFGQGYKMEKGN